MDFEVWLIWLKEGARLEALKQEESRKSPTQLFQMQEPVEKIFLKFGALSRLTREVLPLVQTFPSTSEEKFSPERILVWAQIL